MNWLPDRPSEPVADNWPPKPLPIYADLDWEGPPRPPTAVGAPAGEPDFGELFAFIDSLNQYELRRLTERLHRRLPPWAWR